MTVDSLQLDNQLLDTRRPVVLSPAENTKQFVLAGHTRFNHQTLMESMGALEGRPLVTFSVVRSFAGGKHSDTESAVRRAARGLR
jgi:hypothetical protein